VYLELALAARSELRKRFGDEQATNNNIERKKDYLGDTKYQLFSIRVGDWCLHRYWMKDCQLRLAC
jgi:hypothetical protein